MTSRAESVTKLFQPRVRPGARRRVLNVGCGDYAPHKLHPVFTRDAWEEVRFDIDPGVKPDLIGSVTDMRDVVSDASFDAVFSSHNLEHLHAFEVGQTLREFHRILRPSGFALITCPDLFAIAELVVDGKLMDTVYESPAGPIRPIDMLFGHQLSVERGNTYMMHNTGFTQQRLGEDLAASGFHEVRVCRGTTYDLWALAMMVHTEAGSTIELLRRMNLDFH